MFTLEENKKIGNHLSKLIDKKYRSKRRFCKEYLEIDGRTADNAAIQKMANRISQIIKGTKSIQTYDLPIFTKLLDVSCEEILSAGGCFAPDLNRLTNYRIAFVKDKAVWEQYIHRDDKLILNTDEYGKTVIDYALEFKNFEFLKYLLENKYLWFVDMDTEDYFLKYGGLSFGSGTSIERRPPQDKQQVLWHLSCPQNDTGTEGVECRRPVENDLLQYKLAGNDNLRMKMISLAIEHGAIELLPQLRAREIPSLYQACCISLTTADCDYFYDEDMVEHIAEASEPILDYFSQEFEIKDRLGHTNKFLFPYMSDLIDLMIKNHKEYAEKLLDRSIKHNQTTYHEIKKLIDHSISFHQKEYLKAYANHYSEEDYKKVVQPEVIENILGFFYFYDNGNIVCFRDIRAIDGLITNIVHAKERSSEKRINSLIEELNASYDKIRNIKDTYHTDRTRK